MATKNVNNARPKKATKDWQIHTWTKRDACTQHMENAMGETQPITWKLGAGMEEWRKHEHCTQHMSENTNKHKLPLTHNYMYMATGNMGGKYRTKEKFQRRVNQRKRQQKRKKISIIPPSGKWYDTLEKTSLKTWRCKIQQRQQPNRKHNGIIQHLETKRTEHCIRPQRMPDGCRFYENSIRRMDLYQYT